jgi:hypothetical protein
VKDRTYRRNGMRCAACGQRFRSTRAFDRHRIGRGDERRCRTRAELLALGWSYRFASGGWTDSPLQQSFKLGGVA